MVLARHGLEMPPDGRSMKNLADPAPPAGPARHSTGNPAMVDWSNEHGRNRGYEAEGIREFSLGRMVRGIVSGRWDDAELERRALAEGTLGAGGALTPEILSASVYRPGKGATRVLEAGAQTIPLDSDSVSIPRLATGVTGGWRNENAPVAESDAVFERVTFTPRTLAVMTRISYELAMDTTPAGAQIIETELIRSLATELDRVAFADRVNPPNLEAS